MQMSGRIIDNMNANFLQKFTGLIDFLYAIEFKTKDIIDSITAGNHNNIIPKATPSPVSKLLPKAK